MNSLPIDIVGVITEKLQDSPKSMVAFMGTHPYIRSIVKAEPIQAPIPVKSADVAEEGLSLLPNIRFHMKSTMEDIEAITYTDRVIALDFFVNLDAVVDISVIARFTNLTYLDVSYNSISNISALANLTNLTFIRNHGNVISNESKFLRILKSLRNIVNSIIESIYD